MQIFVSLKVEDYVYLFYQKGAKALNNRPAELMEHAIFQYAGIVAQNLVYNGNAPAGVRILPYKQEERDTVLAESP